MQDNAKPHVAKETMEFMRYEKIKILKDWPPYSPDLNPIELMWAILKKKLRN